MFDTYYSTCYNLAKWRVHAMKSYSSREIIKILEQDGWYLVHTVGDHF